MLAGTSAPPPRTVEELLGPELAIRLDRLDLLSRKILSGKLPGERRSKRRGRSVEFDDFRNYVPGDDLRHIDWNIFARLDRLFVKLFREEEDLALHLVVDASGSMDVGSPNKLVFAHRLAMALGYVGLVNHNRVSITTFGAGAAVQALAPIRGRTNIQRLARFLIDSLQTRERSGDPQAAFREAMRAVGRARSSRGIMVVLSDFLVPGGCDDGLMYLGAGALSGTLDCYCLQLLSPGELDPTREQVRGLVGDLRLTDVETGKAAEVTVTPATIARYRQRLNDSIAQLKADCLSRGLAHFVVSTDTAIDQLILNSLRRGGLLR